MKIMLRAHEHNLIKRILKSIFPHSQHKKLRHIYEKLKYEYGTQRYCPVCQKHLGKFKPCGRIGCLCPFCGSKERHRLVWVFFRTQTNLFDTATPKRMLHIAPEPCFEEVLKKEDSIEYLSGDIDEERAMEKVDVTDITYPDDTFDIIYASHVLEHVPEDRKAMRELHRVLAPEGWAVLQVPINVEETFEGPSVTDPEERRRLFGQPGHVRRYGTDYRDRLQEAGFSVTTYPATEVVGEENVERMGIIEGTKVLDVYFCEKG